MCGTAGELVTQIRGITGRSRVLAAGSRGGTGTVAMLG